MVSRCTLLLCHCKNTEETAHRLAAKCPEYVRVWRSADLTVFFTFLQTLCEQYRITNFLRDDLDGEYDLWVTSMDFVSYKLKPTKSIVDSEQCELRKLNDLNWTVEAKVWKWWLVIWCNVIGCIIQADQWSYWDWQKFFTKRIIYWSDWIRLDVTSGNLPRYRIPSEISQFGINCRPMILAEVLLSPLTFIDGLQSDHRTVCGTF